MRRSYPDAPPSTPRLQPSRGDVTNIRIGYEHPDSLLTYPDAPFLSRCAVPIQMRGSYPDAWFLSRRTGGGLTPPIDRLLTPPRALSASAQYTDNLSACTGHAHDRPRSRPSTPLSCAAGRKPCGAHPTTPRTPHTSRAPRTTAPDTHPPPAHTKRARTNRSGRATYSAQALGRLPWFAPCLRRSRRLRPRFDMSFSLGLLSRLKHFCTH